MEVPLDGDVVLGSSPGRVDIAIELDLMGRIICGLDAGCQIAEWYACPAQIIGQHRGKKACCDDDGSSGEREIGILRVIRDSQRLCWLEIG